MVGEPLLKIGEDFMGVRLPVEMDPPRIGGSGLAGRGCASVSERQTTDKNEQTRPLRQKRITLSDLYSWIKNKRYTSVFKAPCGGFDYN